MPGIRVGQDLDPRELGHPPRIEVHLGEHADGGGDARLHGSSPVFQRRRGRVERLGEELDTELQPMLDRPVEQLDQMEKVVLRIGAFELLHCPELPFRVVIDECVDLANRFGSEKGHAYVNAVLDKAARQWRIHEADGPAEA